MPTTNMKNSVEIRCHTIVCSFASKQADVEQDRITDTRQLILKLTTQVTSTES